MQNKGNQPIQTFQKQPQISSDDTRANSNKKTLQPGLDKIKKDFIKLKSDLKHQKEIHHHETKSKDKKLEKMSRKIKQLEEQLEKSDSNCKELKKKLLEKKQKNKQVIKTGYVSQHDYEKMLRKKLSAQQVIKQLKKILAELNQQNLKLNQKLTISQKELLSQEEIVKKVFERLKPIIAKSKQGSFDKQNKSNISEKSEKKDENNKDNKIENEQLRMEERNQMIEQQQGQTIQEEEEDCLSYQSQCQKENIQQFVEDELPQPKIEEAEEEETGKVEEIKIVSQVQSQEIKSQLMNSVQSALQIQACQVFEQIYQTEQSYGQKIEQNYELTYKMEQKVEMSEGKNMSYFFAYIKSYVMAMF